jgi:hypothetical protein
VYLGMYSRLKWNLAGTTYNGSSRITNKTGSGSHTYASGKSVSSHSDLHLDEVLIASIPSYLIDLVGFVPSASQKMLSHALSSLLVSVVSDISKLASDGIMLATRMLRPRCSVLVTNPNHYDVRSWSIIIKRSSWNH